MIILGSIGWSHNIFFSRVLYITGTLLRWTWTINTKINTNSSRCFNLVFLCVQPKFFYNWENLSRICIFTFSIKSPYFMYSANYPCQFGTCSSITKTLERYQKSSYGGPDTAVQNKENEVSLILLFISTCFSDTPCSSLPCQKLYTNTLTSETIYVDL